MAENNIMATNLTHTSFLQRENNTKHHSYEYEMSFFEYLKQGDINALEKNKFDFNTNLTGHLSDNPLRNRKYLFICFITLATRFVIDGGMEAEKAYNISDIYIQRVDLLKTTEAIDLLTDELLHYLLKKINEIKKQSIYSKSIVKSMDYIYYHLHEPIRVTQVAAYVNLNSSYFSTLFKKELGISVSDYIINNRIEAAKNMLKFSDYSILEISNYLAFSSQSYFTSVFNKNVGLTPKAYRTQYFRIGFIQD